MLQASNNMTQRSTITYTDNNSTYQYKARQGVCRSTGDFIKLCCFSEDYLRQPVHDLRYVFYFRRRGFRARVSYTYIYIYIYIYTYAYTHVCMYVYIYIYIHIHTHAHIHQIPTFNFWSGASKPDYSRGCYQLWQSYVYIYIYIIYTC